jgi:hypothetical protein
MVVVVRLVLELLECVAIYFWGGWNGLNKLVLIWTVVLLKSSGDEEEQEQQELNSSETSCDKHTEIKLKLLDVC